MSEKTINVGIGHIPTTEIENRATVTTYDTRPYINAGSHDNEFQQLRNHPTIRDFASVNPEIYGLVASTNPTLKLFFDVARRIMEAEV